MGLFDVGLKKDEKNLVRLFTSTLQKVVDMIEKLGKDKVLIIKLELIDKNSNSKQ